MVSNLTAIAADFESRCDRTCLISPMTTASRGMARRPPTYRGLATAAWNSRPFIVRSESNGVTTRTSMDVPLGRVTSAGAADAASPASAQAKAGTKRFFIERPPILNYRGRRRLGADFVHAEDLHLSLALHRHES